MPRQTIASSLFLKRGPLTKAILSSLHIRGSGVQVDGALLRKGWDGQQPVVTSIITVDPSTAKIRGTRYETRGAIAHVVKLKAADLWADAKEGINVVIDLDDLSIIKWVTEGDHRHMSAWIEGKDLNVTLRKGDTVIQEAAKEENGVGSFVVRFTILPGDVSTSLLCAGALPCTKAELREKLQEVDRIVKNVQKGKALGLIVSDDISWRDNTEKVVKSCIAKLSGLWRCTEVLGESERKTKAEWIILSRLFYCLETTSTGLKSNMEKLQGVQSSAARWVLQTKRMNWSLRGGLKHLGWLSVVQQAAYCSVRLALQILQRGLPERLYRELTFIQGGNQVRKHLT